jgi:hypothetical protein
MLMVAPVFEIDSAVAKKTLLVVQVAWTLGKSEPVVVNLLAAKVIAAVAVTAPVPVTVTLPEFMAKGIGRHLS